MVKRWVYDDESMTTRPFLANSFELVMVLYSNRYLFLYTLLGRTHTHGKETVLIFGA